METHDESEFYTHRTTGVPVHKATAILTFDSLIGSFEDNAEGIDAMILQMVVARSSPTAGIVAMLHQGREALLQVMAEEAAKS